jgi:hypothetical protein
MGGAALRRQFESVLGGPLTWQSRPAPEMASTGVREVDAATGGLPRGGLTEIHGAASSGRTSLLFSVLAEATGREEVCALVDAEDCFDPRRAAAAGVRLNRLLWVRCAHDAEQALKAADLLIQGGGFGLVAMDLGDTPVEAARRISLTSWFRLRRAVENTPTVFLALARQSNAKTCASLTLECGSEAGVRVVPFSGRGPGRLLGGIRVQVMRRKPGPAAAAAFDARSCEKSGWQAKAPAPQEWKSVDSKVGQTLSSVKPRERAV